MGSGLPRYFHVSAHDWGQVLTFQGKTCSPFGSGSLLVNQLVNWVNIRTNRTQELEIEIKNGTGPRIDLLVHRLKVRPFFCPRVAML